MTWRSCGFPWWTWPQEVGSDRSQNMIMIGAVCAKAGLLSMEETFVGMQKALKGKDKFFEMNQKGIEKGFAG
jgi:2-oxoglutarate ferredoxin oxidoreductase subunit gamma